MPEATPGAAHVAAFFSTDESLVERVSSFIAEGLAAHEHIVVVATLPHWNAVAARLEETGVAYGRAAIEGRLVLIDAAHVLDSITRDGQVSIDAFREMLVPLITLGSPRRVYGELVSLLVQRGDVEGALAIESVGHELTHTHGVRVLCGYGDGAAVPLTPATIDRLGRAHDHVLPESPAPAPGADDRTHAVRFYENAESLARLVGRFLGTGFVAGLPGIVIATPSHRAAIAGVLAARQFDVPQLEATGRLLMVDATETLAAFMVDGMPHPSRFREHIVPLIERAADGKPDRVVRAYGEMVDVLWRRGDTAAAIRLETLWNQLAQTHAFSLLCGYAMGHFYKDAARRDIIALHTHVVDGPPEPALVQ